MNCVENWNLFRTGPRSKYSKGPDKNSSPNSQHHSEFNQNKFLKETRKEMNYGLSKMDNFHCPFGLDRYISEENWDLRRTKAYVYCL